jgi:intracellular septation protein A
MAIGFRFWTYHRRFMAQGLPCALRFEAGLKGTQTILSVADVEHDACFRPAMGEQAVINHQLTAVLPDGAKLNVEAGYFNWWNIAIAAHLNGALIHESHPGKAIRLPDRAIKMMTETNSKIDPETGKIRHDPAMDYSKISANKVPIAVDIATGLLFFVVAKLTDLTTAALVGAGVGIALVIAQRFVKVDLLGGLAMFGIVMLLISAGFAYAFQDEDWVKMRSTIVGLIGATVFLSDGLLFKGRYMGRALSRYIAYTDIREHRLSISLGLVGIAMAALNYGVARLFSTDIWLFYTTFGDIFVSFAMALYAINWSRRGSMHKPGNDIPV